MTARLFARTGDIAGYEATFDAALTVGRAGRNDLVIPQSFVSRDHARIAFDNELGTYVIEDLGSRSGVWVDGIRVDSRRKLGALHVISIANKLDFIFQALGPPTAVSDTVVDTAPQ